MKNVNVNTNTIRKKLIKVAFLMVALSTFSWAKGIPDMNAATAESHNPKELLNKRLSSNPKAFKSNSQFSYLNTSLKSILKEICQVNNPFEELYEVEHIKNEQNQTNATGVIVVPGIAAPEKPVIEKLVSSKTKTATVRYSKCLGASGYEISYATSKSGTYKVAGTTTNTSYKIGRLTKGKTYYVRVRAYKVVNSKKVYSSYSTVKSVKVT